MGAFEAARATRPHPCCRDVVNLRAITVEGTAGPGVLARQCERCTVCGCRHFGGVFQPGQHGVTPAPVTIGGV